MSELFQNCLGSLKSLVFFFIIMVLNLSVIIGSFAWKKVKSFMVLFVAVVETCVQYIRKVPSEV